MNTLTKDELRLEREAYLKRMAKRKEEEDAMFPPKKREKKLFRLNFHVGKKSRVVHENDYLPPRHVDHPSWVSLRFKN